MRIFAKNSDRYPLNMQNNTKIRQQAILDIIQAGPVFSQDELAARLREAGISSTQATLSRDLKALRISKVPGEGYIVPARGRSLSVDFTSGILRIQFSANLGVIRTRPGLANAVAVLIDNHMVHSVLGTIAGDDTILLILQEGSTPEVILDALTPLFPEIKNRYVQ